MDDIQDEIISEELCRHEQIYYEQYQTAAVTPQTQFNYGWCLIRSRYPVDIKKGLVLLEELCVHGADEKRNYLYFLAVGYAKIKQYDEALDCINQILKDEPNNRQVKKLKERIKKKKKDENLAVKAILGLFMAGVAAIGLISLRFIETNFSFK